jgi:hypothetical protein
MLAPLICVLNFYEKESYCILPPHHHQHWVPSPVFHLRVFTKHENRSLHCAIILEHLRGLETLGTEWEPSCGTGPPANVAWLFLLGS